MCGLIAYLGTKEQKAEVAELEAREAVINQYEEQHTRGQKGFGTMTIEDGKVKIRRATEPVKAFFDIRDAKGNIVLFHHRMPTSTPNMLDQTHPFFVPGRKGKNPLFVMHNGVIRNDDELKELHESLGFDYQSEYVEVGRYAGTETVKFNDSESLAIELARFLRGDIEEIGALGATAFLAFETDKKFRPIAFHYGRNHGHELRIVRGENGILLASEARGELIEAETLYTHVIEDGKLGPLSTQALPFAAPPPVTVSPPSPAPTATSTTGHSHSKTSETGSTGDDRTRKEKKKDEYEFTRESAFAFDTDEAEEFANAMEEITDETFGIMQDDLISFQWKLKDGEGTKRDVQDMLKNFAAYLMGLVNAQDTVESSIIRSKNTRTMESLEPGFSSDDFPPGWEKNREVDYPIKLASESFKADLADHITAWGATHSPNHCRKPEYHTRLELADAHYDANAKQTTAPIGF